MSLRHAEGPVGVFTTDRALVVRSWDAWLSDASGVAEAEATGRPLGELFPELEARGVLARLRRVAESGVVAVLASAFHEYLIPCPTRAPSAHFARMQQHVTVAPLRAGDEVVGVAVTIEDVTARRERERDLALALESPDEAVRLRATRELAGAGEGGRAGPLAGALGDPSWRVRRAAADGLARGIDDSALDALLAALRERHRDPAVLNAALAALVQARQDVVPPLVRLLATSTSDADVRTYTALALGLLEDRRAVPALVDALSDPDDNVRFHAIEALGRIRSRAAALPVAAVAETRDFAVAFAALDTLALIGEPSVAPRLLPLLDDELLQSAAAEALGRLGGEDAVAPLAALLDRDGAPVAAVAGALAALSDRLDGAAGRGDGRVATLARAVVTERGASNLLAAMTGAGDEELAGLVVVLGWLSCDGVERALAGVLPRAAVRRTAADILARRGAAAVEPLLAALASDDDEVRKAAAATLGRIGAPAALPPLLTLLDDSPEVVVVAAGAIGAIGAIGDGRGLDPLLALLDHPHAGVRQAAVAAVSSIGHPSTQDRVRSLLAHSSPRVREGAAKLAGYFGDDASVERLLALCHDPDEAVRRAVVEQLPHVGDSRALAAVGAALQSETSSVRAAAARAMAHVRAEEALPRLVAACRDADPWVRYYAARSLGHLGATAAIPALASLAADDLAPPVRIAAIDALTELHAEDVPALHPLADDPDPAVARQALLALGRSKAPRTPRPLLDALRGDDSGRLLAALDAVGQRDDPDLVEAVAPLAGAADPELRGRALGVLATLGGERAVAALIAIAEDPRQTAAVADALARLGADESGWVGRGLEHPDVAVRCAVVEALGRTRHPAAQPLLVGALRDADEAVRLAAAHALARLDLHDATG